MHTLIALLPPPIEGTPGSRPKQKSRRDRQNRRHRPGQRQRGRISRPMHRLQSAGRKPAPPDPPPRRRHQPDRQAWRPIRHDDPRLAVRPQSPGPRTAAAPQARNQSRRRRSGRTDPPHRRPGYAQRRPRARQTRASLKNRYKISCTEKRDVSETPAARPRTVARVKAHIDAALRSAGADWRQCGLTRSNNAHPRGDQRNFPARGIASQLTTPTPSLYRT